MRKLHTVLLFAQNKRGVLERITMMIRKKMYNLEQITSSDTEKEDIKRITISFSHEEEAKLEQIVSQLKTIVEVIEAKIIDHQISLLREVAIIKVKRESQKLSEIIALVDIFKAEVVFTKTDYVILQIVGTPRKIQDFISLIQPFGILEMGSSGGVAMEK